MSKLYVDEIENLNGSIKPVKNIVAKVDTIIDLLQIDTSKLETGEQFHVLGYHTRNDGGGGIFYWDADEDKANHNGGTIIDPTQTFPSDWNDPTQQETWFTASGTGNGCWKRVVGDVVNIKWFGAKGDRVTDNYNIFKKLISQRSKFIYVPLGEYYVSQPLKFDYLNLKIFGNVGGNQANYTQGNTSDASVLILGNISGDSITFHNDSWSIKRVILEDLMIISSTSDGRCIFLNDTEEVAINRCVIINDSDGTDQIGIDILDSHLISIVDSYIEKKDYVRTSNSSGFVIRLSSNSLAGLYNIINTTFKAWYRGCIFGHITYGTGLRLRNVNLTGSQAKDCNIGFSFQNGVSNCHINTCYMEGNRVTGLETIKGAEQIKISNSFFNNPQASAADLCIGRVTGTTEDQYFKDIVVDCCKFENINDKGIFVAPDTDISNSNNVIIRSCNFKEYNAGVGTGIYLRSPLTITRIIDCSFSTDLAVTIQNPEFASEIKNTDGYEQNVNIETISSDKHLKCYDAKIQVLEPFDANRTVNLPSPSESKGKEFLIVNPTSSSYNLVVKNYDSSITYETLTPGQKCLAFNDGTTDYVVIL